MIEKFKKIIVIREVEWIRPSHCSIEIMTFLIIDRSIYQILRVSPKSEDIVQNR